MSNGKHYVKYIDEGIVGLTVGDFLSFEMQFDSRVAVGLGGCVVIDATFEYRDCDISNLSIGSSAKSANGEENAISCLKIDNENYTAIVVPQNITIRRPLVEVVSGNVSYLLEGAISYKQGMQSTIVVTLSKNPEQTKIEIGGSMGSWN